MFNDLYSQRLLELAANIPRIGRLEHPDASAKAYARLCGSALSVDLKMDDEWVVDFAHEVQACALGQAAASLMASHVVGKTSHELKALHKTMHAMLEENGPAPTGEWADFAILESIRPYPVRHASTLLTFDAVVKALEAYEAKRALNE